MCFNTLFFPMNLSISLNVPARGAAQISPEDKQCLPGVGVPDVPGQAVLTFFGIEVTFIVTLGPGTACPARPFWRV